MLNNSRKGIVRGSLADNTPSLRSVTEEYVSAGNYKLHIDPPFNDTSYSVCIQLHNTITAPIFTKYTSYVEIGIYLNANTQLDYIFVKDNTIVASGTTSFDI